MFKTNKIILTALIYSLLTANIVFAGVTIDAAGIAHAAKNAFEQFEQKKTETATGKDEEKIKNNTTSKNENIKPHSSKEQTVKAEDANNHTTSQAIQNYLSNKDINVEGCANIVKNHIMIDAKTFYKEDTKGSNPNQDITKRNSVEQLQAMAHATSEYGRALATKTLDNVTAENKRTKTLSEKNKAAKTLTEIQKEGMSIRHQIAIELNSIAVIRNQTLQQDALKNIEGDTSFTTPSGTE